MAGIKQYQSHQSSREPHFDEENHSAFSFSVAAEHVGACEPVAGPAFSSRLAAHHEYDNNNKCLHPFHGGCHDWTRRIAETTSNCAVRRLVVGVEVRVWIERDPQHEHQSKKNVQDDGCHRREHARHQNHLRLKELVEDSSHDTSREGPH